MNSMLQAASCQTLVAPTLLVGFPDELSGKAMRLLTNAKI